MNNIKRNPEEAEKTEYDLIIIGGGIYGVMCSLIASFGKLKTLLLEKDDFGGATSFNSLRIIHGGFRYLQNMDLIKYFESVADRKWFLENFPDLVEPIACLMPLYGNGVFRPSIFKAALLLNDILSFKRNEKISESSRLPNGKVISPTEVEKIFHSVEPSGLKGGAIWYDGSMQDSQRVLIETLKWACSLGTTVLNYFDVKELILNNNSVEGVKAFDKESGNYFDFHSPRVLNAAGPWCRQIAGSFDKEYPNLFISSLAWNVLFNKKALTDHAVAVTPKRKGARTYFLRPLNGKIFAGTVHEPWTGVRKNPIPSEDSINNFITDLNSTIKNIKLKKEDILHIYSGHMPVTQEGTDNLLTHEIILDHSKQKGPKGLFSVSGVKFTTARIVAEKVIKFIFPERKISTKEVRQFRNITRHFDFDWNPDKIDNETIENLRNIIQSESVQHLDDIILRRTSLGDNPIRALKIARKLCFLFNWDDEQCEKELFRLKKYYNFINNSQILTHNLK